MAQRDALFTRRRTELARRLNLLVEVILTADRKPATYNSLAAYLEARQIGLSRARWAYMLSGTRYLVEDAALLGAIADYFEVERSYLLELDGGEIPHKVESALQFLRAERLGAVRVFATRKLGDISPETLAKLTAILDEAEGRG